MRYRNLFMKVFVVIALAAIPNTGTGQVMDTLFYFTPGDTAEPIVVLAVVTDNGVYFVPDTSWPGYSIMNIQLLVASPDTEYVNHIQVREDSSSLPGAILQDIEVTFDNTTNPYPQWYTIDVSDYPALERRTGNFWVTGSALWSGMVQFSDDPFYHTYSYVVGEHPDAPGWVGPENADLVIKAVVMREDSLSIQNNDSYSNDRTKMLNIYPNPFNNHTTVRMPAQIGFNNCIIQIVDLNGREVFRQKMKTNTFVWNGLSSTGQDLSSGIYLVILQRDIRIIDSQKIVYLK